MHGVPPYIFGGDTARYSSTDPLKALPQRGHLL